MKSLRAWVSFGSYAYPQTTSEVPDLAAATPQARPSSAPSAPLSPRGIRQTLSLPHPLGRVSLHALPVPDPVHDLVLGALRCPISNELMTDAVCLADGRSYQSSVVALAPAAQGAASSVAVRARAVPNLAVREICRRVAAGEMPSLAWDVFKSGDAPLLAPCLDDSGVSVAGGGLPRAALMQSMAGGVRAPLTALARPNLALERATDALLAHGLPLHAAVLRGELLALPARAVRSFCFQTDAHGQSALLLAAKYGDAAAVQHLLEQGASPRQGNRAKQTPLLVALERGHGQAAAALAATQQALNQADKFGTFPLLAAAVGRHPSPHMIGVLAGQVAQIDMDQCVGVRALQAATWVQNLDAMRALVAGGADTNLPRAHQAHASVPRSRHGAPLVPQEQSPKLMASMPLDFESLDVLQPARKRPRLERLSTLLSRN